jgi:hypothetical protein
LYEENRDTDIARSFGDYTKQNTPMGQTHVFTSSGQVYPVMCSMRVSSTDAQPRLRCTTWSGSGDAITQLADVTATGLRVPQTTYTSYQSSARVVFPNGCIVNSWI